jgi:hypothetical protein
MRRELVDFGKRRGGLHGTLLMALIVLEGLAFGIKKWM